MEHDDAIAKNKAEADRQQKKPHTAGLRRPPPLLLRDNLILLNVMVYPINLVYPLASIDTNHLPTLKSQKIPEVGR